MKNLLIVYIVIFVVIFFGCNDEKAKAKLPEKFTKSQKIESKEKTPFDIAMEDGAKIYDDVCKVCHQKDGKGVKGVYPPFAKADYLMDDVDRGIRQALFGSDGNFEMIVNGVKYNGIMLAYGEEMNDAQIANVITYITNSFGNKHKLITPQYVKKIREQGKKARENFHE